MPSKTTLNNETMELETKQIESPDISKLADRIASVQVPSVEIPEAPMSATPESKSALQQGLEAWDDIVKQNESMRSALANEHAKRVQAEADLGEAQRDKRAAESEVLRLRRKLFQMTESIIRLRSASEAAFIKLEKEYQS